MEQSDMKITQSRLKELLDYDPETGIFRLKAGCWAPSKVGQIVGTLHKRDNSMVVYLDDKMYALHNLAWLWVYGEFPQKQLLKLDGNGCNTAIKNLALPVRAKRGEISQERLKSLLSYDPETGSFHWLVRPSKNVPIGSRAGSIDRQGYRIIAVDHVHYSAQRLAWLYVYGELPARKLRPLDRNKDNAAISNLTLPEFNTSTYVEKDHSVVINNETVVLKRKASAARERRSAVNVHKDEAA